MAAEGDLTVLGGGIAGLAVGHFARTRGLPFRIYEATRRLGGNCTTFWHGKFGFDSGAHRFHDKDPRVTGEVRRLLNNELRKVTIPSVIYRDGSFVNFPLSPLDLLRRLGPGTFLRAAREVLEARLEQREIPDTLEAFAVQTYGRTIAQLFLLNYSQKLWGLDCRRLSPHATGKRLKGLTLGAFMKEALFGRSAATRHLDGDFLYPEGGIGRIAEKLRDSCGHTALRTRATITKLSHDGRRIHAIEINRSERIPVQWVVSTLPLNTLIRCLDPPPPTAVLVEASHLRFRNLMLVAFFLKAERITEAATVYFPESRFPFTRVYEPKNRSPAMAPGGCTSLVAEIPCFGGDRAWQCGDGELIEQVRAALAGLGWVRDTQVLGCKVVRLPYAYPVLEKGIEAKVQRIFHFLGSFKNLACAGRNAFFQHLSMHEVLRGAREALFTIAGPV